MRIVWDKQFHVSHMFLNFGIIVILFPSELARLEKLRLERLENEGPELLSSSVDNFEAAKEEELMGKVGDAKERLAAMERMQKGRSIGTQTAASDKHNKEVLDKSAFTVKFDAEGIPSLAPATRWTSSSSSSLKSQVWLLPCLRRCMLCYSGQRACLLPPPLFLAYFQEIIHYRLRFPIRPDCSGSGAAAGSATTQPSSSLPSSSPASLRATVSSMRLQRKNSVVLPSSSSSVLSALSSHEYVSSHKSVKSSWSCQSVLFDGFGPEQASFPHFTMRFFQAVYGQKSSADIMCAPPSHSLSLSCR